MSTGEGRTEGGTEGGRDRGREGRSVNSKSTSSSYLAAGCENIYVSRCAARKSATALFLEVARIGAGSGGGGAPPRDIARMIW